jgi:phosphate uptake regulator
MKKWCKIIRLDEYDILVQRSCNNSDGEYVCVTLRVNEGELRTTMGFEDDVEEADKAYANYKKADAEKVVEAFEKMYKNEEEINDKED